MISLIFFGDLKYCPYIQRYIERLELKKSEYEVLFWNRGGFKLELPANYHWYDSASDESLGKVKKMIDFMGFRKWVKKLIVESKSDSIILLSTLTGIFLSDILKRYKKKYVFDIRDYSYEKFGFFRKIEKKIIKNSFFTAISSKGFKNFLPEHDYVIAHNFNRKEIKDEYEFKKQNIPLKVVWNGTVRFFDFQKHYLDALKNDDRFEFIYHGAGTDLEQYKSYCKQNNIKNAVFTGPYNNADKAKLLDGAAILNNCYGGKDGDELRFAVSNRYYDGLIYRIPQIVEPGGYKAVITEENDAGIALNADGDFGDRLYNYYISIDESAFNNSCRRALDEIIKEDDIYISEIDRFIDSV